MQVDIEAAHRARKLRLERIRGIYSSFGISADTQLYELVRKEVRRLIEDGTWKSRYSPPAPDMSLWSDETCRQHLNARGGRQYLTFVDVICLVFAQLDKTTASAEQKHDKYEQLIFSPDSKSDDSTFKPYQGGIAHSLFPFFREVLPLGSEVDADAFYNASSQGLAATLADLDIRREVYDVSPGLMYRLADSLKGSSPKLFFVDGVAGSGKTVLLNRLIVDAIREGYSVLRCSTGLLDPSAIFTKLFELKSSAERPTIFVFDDCYRMFGRGTSLAELMAIDLLAVPGPQAAMVLSDNWGLRPGYNQLVAGVLSTRPTILHVNELSAHELDHLLDRIYSAEQTGQIKDVKCTLPKSERLSLVGSRRDRLVTIALLKLRYGKNISELLKDEYDSLQSERLRQLYSQVIILDSIGLTTPAQYARRQLTSDIVEPGLAHALKVLFQLDANGYRVRHPVLVQPLLRSVLPDVQDRGLILNAIVQKLDWKNHLDRQFWLEFTSSPGVAKRIFRLFYMNKDAMRSFTDSLRVFTNDALGAGLGASLFALLGTIYKDIFFELEQALVDFSKAYDEDSLDPYVVRQLAWTTLKLGRMPEAERYCREAVDNWPDDPVTLSEAAFIMSWCSRKGFEDADEFYRRASALDPTSREISRKWERYQEAATVNSYFRGSDLSDTVLEEIGAPSFIWRVRRHARKQYSRAVFRELSNSLRRDRFDLQEIEEMLSSARGLSDRGLQGLVDANIARAEYERWYQFGEPVDLQQVRVKFQSAIEKCPQDPFIRTWYGTYLKEVVGDYDAAEEQYKDARSIAKKSKAEHIVEHPMILNNIALLIMDGVYKQVRSAERLLDAHKIISKAIERMIETDSEFHWPVATLASLRLQADEFHISLPRD